MKRRMGSPAKETIRAFVALDLDAMSVRRVARVSDRLRMASGAPSATWTPSAKMHITLKFMAELPSDAVTALAKALGALAEGRRGPKVGAFHLAAFPSVGDARVVVLELKDPDGSVGRLAERVERLAQKQGIAQEKRPFQPHVTLARLKMPYDARRWLRAELADGAEACRAARLTLYRSELHKDGATYVPLATFEYVAE
jgi:2'-5' RNA ligase